MDLVKEKRADDINRLITVIGTTGRQFFHKKGFFANIEVDERGKVWWLDDYTKKRIYTHETGFRNKWRGFSHGGTMKELVKSFRDYITTGKKITHLLGPWPDWLCDGDLWGYGEDMQKVRAFAVKLGVYAEARG